MECEPVSGILKATCLVIFAHKRGIIKGAWIFQNVLMCHAVLTSQEGCIGERVAQLDQPRVPITKEAIKVCISAADYFICTVESIKFF
ncbi:hypothetical protein TNCT_123501 [Trichonephila clavata]|uniref:Uncharacterized protein n=1 Tax=Trichonephila clavata TaxID=2740835 RepID=A0A8X6KZV2_TRICU|nr:hypothetical protein TNCT_123501 [Trichonephila clavata]